MTQATIVTAGTATRWAKALDRAIINGLDVLVSTNGEAFVESASVPGLIYSVSREHCSCPAGLQGKICQHRACFLAQIGELPLEPVSRVTFFGNSDRQEVCIDGMVYGDAVADQWGGWVLFQGRYPHAKQRGTFCSLDEIKRELMARMPVTLPIHPEVQVVELATAAA